MIESAFPLCWPDGQARTPQEKRTRNWPFWRGTLDRHRRSLKDEVRKLNGKDLIISTNMRLRNDGEIHAGAGEPADGGVAVYFSWKNRPMCFACDQFETVRETIDSIRAIERYGASDMMERAFRGFTALPEQAGEPWRTVFGFTASESVTSDRIEEAFRKLAFTEHPDHGGTSVRFQRIINARTDARRAIGETA